MKFLEKNLEQIIWDNLQSSDGRYELEERGFPFCLDYVLHARQLRIGNYGIADIVSLFRIQDVFYITVFELKKGAIDEGALIQAARYSKGISQYLKRRFPKKTINIESVLVGSSINTGDWVYLFDGLLNNVSVVTYSYEIDGIKFNCEEMNYELIDEGFNV